MQDRQWLFLVQHGDALAEEIDPDRPLSQQGRSAIENLAGFLAERGVRVDHIWHSGKARARQTAEILAASLLRQDEAEEAKGLKPKDSPEDVLPLLLSVRGSLMVCSHLPLLGKLVARLVTGSEHFACVAFSPGTLVALERTAGDEFWSISLLLPPAILQPG